MPTDVLVYTTPNPGLELSIGDRKVEVKVERLLDASCYMLVEFSLAMHVELKVLA